MPFKPRHTTEWRVVLKSKPFRLKRKEIEKRCKDILNDPFTAHKAHPYHHEFEGYWGAYLDDLNRIMYKIDEAEWVVTFCTICDPGH